MKELIEKISKGTRKKTVKVLAGVVAFATAYSLILPAITIDEETAQEEPGMVLNENENTEEVLAEYEAPEEVAEAPSEEPAAEEAPAEEAKEEAPAEETAAETVTEETAPAEPAAQTPAEETKPAEEPKQEVAEIVLEATAGKLEYEAKEDYKITVEYTKDAGFAEGTELEIKETLKEDEYANSLVKAQKEFEEEEIAQARFFETVFLAEGEEFKTAKGKAVVTYEPEKMEIAENQEVTVLTTDKEGKYKEVDEKKLSVKERENKIEEINFETEDLESFTILVLEKEAEEVAETPAEETVAEVLAEEKPAMPAASFAKTVGDVTVSVEAPEGAFPEGTQMEIELVDENQYIDAINETIDENEQVKKAQAVDIRFIYNNEEIEPQQDIKVRIISDVLKQTEDPKLIHIDNEGSASVVDTVSETNTYSEEINNPSKTESVESLTFTSDEFSVYIIIETETIETQVKTGSGDTLKVTVEVSNENDIHKLKGLKVTELDPSSEAYQQAFDVVTAEKEAKGETFDGFFAADIELLDENDKAFEPEGTVSVRIELINLPADEDILTSTMEVQHLAEKNGTIDVQTVATSKDVEIVNEVVTTEFSVESFSTFTLTWTGNGSSEVVPEDQAKAVLNIQSGNETYATVNVHYVDVYGHNIRSPFTTSVNGTTPVTIEGLLDGEIEGYEYQESHYGSYDGTVITSVSASRTSNEETGTSYTYIGTTGNDGRINGSYSAPTGYDAFYTDETGTTEVYFGNTRWRTMDGERYKSGPVYGATTGTITNYTHTISFDNTDIEASTNTGTSSIWEEAADIYLVYESTDASLKSATIHYGTYSGSTFSEFGNDKLVSLDATSSSLSLAVNFNGYSYSHAYYLESNESTEQITIDPILYKNNDIWEVSKHITNEDETTSIVRAPVENGSHIYVVYSDPVTHGQSGDDVEGPKTIKTVTDNEDGTYTIQLDVEGTVKHEEHSTGANVLIILDRTYSMATSMGSQSRWDAAIDAIDILINTLSTGENANNDIEYSFVGFSNVADDIHTWTGSERQYWTKSASTYKTYVDNLSHKGFSESHGTNWEAGLYQAQTPLANGNRDSDQTYVIFVTDGEPNAKTSSGGTVVSWAETRAKEITDLDKISFYGVFCGNDAGATQVQSLVTAAGGVKAINGTDEATLKSEFTNIAQTIINNLGSTGVSVDDGVPSLSSVSTTTGGAAGGFEYYKATGENPEDSDFSTWTDAPGATYSSDNGVTWDLSSIGALADKTTYRLKFKVWPSQAAYDLIANLNNGTITKTDEELASLSITRNASTGKYYLNTNTHLKTTFTYDGVTYTDPSSWEEEEMDLLSEQMTVRKAFSHAINSADPFTSIEFYLLQDGKYYQKDGTTSATFDDSKVYKLPVNTSNNWENKIYIAPGFMEGEEVLESGHKYTLEEKVLVGSEYEYEFTPQTVRPMIIDGTLTYLVLVDDYNAPGKNNVPSTAKTYQIGNETYYVASVNNGELVGTNRKTAELDITKVVETNGILSDEEEAEETFTYRVTLQIPDGTDPAGIVGYEYVYRPTQDNAYYLYGYHNYDGGKPVASAFEDDIARLGENKYRAWNTLIYQDLIEWENVNGKIVSKKDADGNIIWKIPASGGYHTITYDMTLKQNEVIRFTNLPTGTKYTIQEIYANKYKADNVGGDTSGKAPVSDPSNIESEGYTINIKKTAGTVSQTAVANDTVSGTINGLDTRFYNQFTNTMEKTVDVNILGTKKLDGYDWSGESYHFTLTTTGNNPMPAEASGKSEFDLTAESGNEDQTDTFGRIRFVKAGTYTYTVSETNAGTLQVVNGKAVKFGDAVTITIVIEENETTHDLTVKSVTGTGVTWDEDSKTATATITNTAPTTTVSANKEWLNADLSTDAPKDAKVTFTLYQDGTSTGQTVELDGSVDENGEETAWTATWKGLQKYKVVDGEAVEIVYTIFEEDSGKYRGYDRVNESPVVDGGTITNQQSTLWVQFKKTNMSGDGLADAVFTFNDEKSSADMTITSGTDGIMATTATGSESSKNMFELAIREEPYALNEDTAPDGYLKLTDAVNIYVTVDGVSAKLGDTQTQYVVTGSGTEQDPYIVKITNTDGTALPHTGGSGTLPYTLGGLILIIISASMYGFMMRRRERRFDN